MPWDKVSHCTFFGAPRNIDKATSSDAAGQEVLVSTLYIREVAHADRNLVHGRGLTYQVNIFK